MMDLISYLILIFLTGIIKLFPFRFNQRVAKFYGALFYYILPYRKKVAKTNLKLAFAEKNENELTRILKGVYKHFTSVLAEVACLPKINSGNYKNYVQIINEDLVHNKIKEGKGLIVLTAHFGNWEIFAHTFGLMLNSEFNSVVKKLKNKYVDNWVTNSRRLVGNKMIEMNSSREIVRVLNNKETLFLLGDQSAPKESIKTKFFIDNVPTFQGAASLALKFHVPVFFAVAVRNPDLTFTINFQVLKTENYTEYNVVNITKLTQDYINLLTESIRKYPEQYLWFHRRFKHNINY
jgi:Kdo2-lipid IVA lauroyltransferase/acyltransferase